VPNGAEGYTNEDDDEEEAGPNVADMFAQQMFGLLSQQFTGMQAPQTAQRQPRQQAVTEHQGHAAGDRNLNSQAPRARQSGGFTMSFGAMSGAFPMPGGGAFPIPGDGGQDSPANNPMLRGIASLLSNQFGIACFNDKAMKDKLKIRYRLFSECLAVLEIQGELGKLIIGIMHSVNVDWTILSLSSWLSNPTILRLLHLLKQ
jgi:hypothetical protein